jgi:alkanesulfonate monooxygenase SsuD/methylene tetrahydromethanopterin reductase-like flavin-dependent oxidoreductase (luciferase family)
MTVHKIGYSLGPLLSTSDVLSCARIADAEKSVDSLWVPESWGRESFATLAAMSQLTKKVRLGTSIIGIYSRTPATVAMAATTLDMLSDSRTVIGLGASTEAIVENWHGVKFDSPVDRMKEFIECLKLMTSGDKVNYQGKFFQIRNFGLLHKPARKQIPVFMAAVNKRMVSLACQLADGILLYMRPLDELRATVPAIIREATNKRFEVACSFICAVSDANPEKARERAAKTLAFYVAVGKYYSKFLSANGFGKEISRISDAYKSGGVEEAAKQVSEEMLDALAICGSRSDCRKSLSRFTSAGITLPIIQVNPVEGAESSFRELLSTFHSG